ncbi:MAG: glycosyltransferase family 4 protein, partial [Isosphaeraceae bacterium]
MSPRGTLASRHATDPPGERPLDVAMFTPSAFGGHARYTRELLSALVEAGETRGVRPSLVTSEDLADEHRTDAYPIHAVLPRLVPRSEFPGKAAWAASRLTHYPRRERALLRWVKNRPGLDLLHTQELTPWIAPWLYRAVRRRGVAVVETVHNIHAHHYFNRAHRALGDRLTRAAWRTCDALLVHTEGLQAELFAYLGPGHPPVFVSPHGVW